MYTEWKEHFRVKRLMALLMLLCIGFTGLCMPEQTAWAEDDGTLVESGDVEGYNEDEVVTVVGDVYPDKVLSDFDSKSPALYKAMMLGNTSGYIERDIESKRVFRIGDSAAQGEVLYVDPTWVIMRYKDDIAYVKRRRIYNVKAIDESTTPPYGTQKHTYIATTATTCHVRKSMSDQDDSWVVLNEGTMLSIWCFIDGWAVVNYWRTYGYINVNELTNLIPVSPTDEPIREDSPIAAYTSYYKMDDTEKNRNRIVNISLGCSYISDVYQPGEVFDGNKRMGPYNRSKGYLPAGALADGTTTTSYGGGTCQVSSTLYNALLQLPGITILYRRAHGANAASYLPHGVDAAVGNDTQNLKFRNDYDFPIRIEGHTSGDGALCMLIYRVYDDGTDESAE